MKLYWLIIQLYLLVILFYFVSFFILLFFYFDIYYFLFSIEIFFSFISSNICMQTSRPNASRLRPNTSRSTARILRNSMDQFTKDAQIKTKKMKNTKYLKEEIYNNHNIFDNLKSVERFSKTMKAQNIVWAKNYQFKEQINILTQENSSLKARIWNVQKQNRKMNKQIQNWGLKKLHIHSKRPYIDTATLQKVIKDQDYGNTSLKLQISKLQKELILKSEIIKNKLQQSKKINLIKKSLNHESNQIKIRLYQKFYLPLQNTKNHLKSWNQAIDKVQIFASQIRYNLTQKRKQLQEIQNNTQLKKKSKIQLNNQLSLLDLQLEKRKQISKQKLIYLNDQIRRFKTQDQTLLKQEVWQLQKIRQSMITFQCETQDRIGNFIKKKFSLRQQISQCDQKLSKVISRQKGLDLLCMFFKAKANIRPFTL